MFIIGGCVRLGYDRGRSPTVARALHERAAVPRVVLARMIDAGVGAGIE